MVLPGSWQEVADYTSRHIPDLFAMLLSLVAHWWLFFRRTAQSSRAGWIRLLGTLSLLWTAGAFVFSMWGFTSLVPYYGPGPWLRGLGILWALPMITCASVSILLDVARPSGFSPERRQMLSTAVAAVPGVTLAHGVITSRQKIEFEEVNLVIPGLAPDLQGLRIAQLSDIHLGPFFTPADLRRAIGMANDTRPHLTLVTGDLITARPDPLFECLDLLQALKADAGVLGCLGNHEIVAECEALTKLEGARRGIDFLRQERRLLQFGGAKLNVAGVDYQRRLQPYLAGAEKLAEPGVTNILLSHNPDVFPVAAAKGFDVTIAGHTHGGQVTIEILRQHANVVRFYTQYVSGLYQSAGQSIYVNRGLGTVGVPVRVGAPAEVTLFRLCAT